MNARPLRPRRRSDRRTGRGEPLRTPGTGRNGHRVGSGGPEPAFRAPHAPRRRPASWNRRFQGDEGAPARRPPRARATARPPSRAAFPDREEPDARQAGPGNHPAHPLAAYSPALRRPAARRAAPSGAPAHAGAADQGGHAHAARPTTLAEGARPFVVAFPPHTPAPAGRPGPPCGAPAGPVAAAFGSPGAPGRPPHPRLRGPRRERRILPDGDLGSSSTKSIVRG